MKFRKLAPLALLAFSFSALTFTACKKEETTPTNNNGGNNNGGNNGGNNTDWNWTGTSPFSVKIDGAAYSYDTAFAIKSSGYVTISAVTYATSKAVGIVFPDAATAGTEYSIPNAVTAATFSFTDGTTTNVYGCQSGKIKVISISGTEVEGKFYGTMKHMSNATTKEAKEGYFKIKF